MQHKPYRRWYHTPIGTPAVVLLLLAVGLWFLWPEGRYEGLRPVRLPDPGVAYLAMAETPAGLYMRHDLFASPSSVGFSGLSDPEQIRDRPVHVASRPTHLYTESIPLDTAPPVSCGVADDPLRVAALPGPRLPPPAVLPAPTGTVVRVLLSTGLKEAGFDPELGPDLIGDALGDWDARFCVQLRPDGRVTDAMLEEGELPEPALRETIARLESSRIPAHTGVTHGTVRVQLSRR